jgi:predicted enzyme related to lactoylglutathione lyase
VSESYRWSRNGSASVPVADVDRAKAFYVDQVGFGVEQDVQVDENHRFVELMPPGSPCSVALTAGYIDSQPGCLKGAGGSQRRTVDLSEP